MNYKDNDPITTINKIRTILNSNGILPVEALWFTSMEGYNSVHINIPNTNMFTNGKGINYELTLASGYGEFMERLQNQYLYKYQIDFSNDVETYRNFYFAPDEKYFSTEDILHNSDSESIYIPPIAKKSLSYDFITKWKSFSPTHSQSDILTIPFYDANTKNISYVPLAVIELYYSTNGMCAGNTREEALVQGISEIMERYVNYKILEGSIIPPTIPEEYLKNFPRQYDMIQTFMKTSNYKLIVKDCSLNDGFPAVGIVVIDSQHQKYFWGLGAHPVFEIALERTLTELIQGHNIHDFNLMDFSSHNNSLDSTLNKMKVFRDGRGYYPTSVFSCEYSYQFKPFQDMSNKTNREMLKYLLDLLKQKQYNILVRDVSFMGFPSFQIIIPSLTEILTDVDIYLDKKIEEFEIRKIVRNLNVASFDDLNKIINHLEVYDYTDKNSLADLVGVPVKYSFPWHDIKKSLFLCAAYYKMGKLEESHDAIDKFLRNEKLFIEELDEENVAWYKCIRDYIGLSIDGLNIDEIEKSLDIFYEDDILQDVLSYMENANNIFERYSSLNCWNCNECDFNEHCFYQNTKNIVLTIKDIYYNNQINQLVNNSLFYE